jgi:hypothetical protein
MLVPVNVRQLPIFPAFPYVTVCEEELLTPFTSIMAPDDSLHSHALINPFNKVDEPTPTELEEAVIPIL